MGRAIENAKEVHDIKRRLKLVEDALEEMIQTKVHHVDLTDAEVKPKGVEVKPDKEFTSPPRTKRTKAATATT